MSCLGKYFAVVYSCSDGLTLARVIEAEQADRTGILSRQLQRKAEQADRTSILSRQVQRKARQAYRTSILSRHVRKEEATGR